MRIPADTLSLRGATAGSIRALLQELRAHHVWRNSCDLWDGCGCDTSMLLHRTDEAIALLSAEEARPSESIRDEVRVQLAEAQRLTAELKRQFGGEDARPAGSIDKLLAACRYWETKKLALDASRPDFTRDQLRELEAAEGRLLAAIHDVQALGLRPSAEAAGEER